MVSFVKISKDIAMDASIDTPMDISMDKSMDTPWIYAWTWPWIFCRDRSTLVLIRLTQVPPRSRALVSPETILVVAKPTRRGEHL